MLPRLFLLLAILAVSSAKLHKSNPVYSNKGDLEFFGALQKASTPRSSDAAFGVNAPKTVNDRSASPGEFDHLMAYMSFHEYYDGLKDGDYVSVPFGNGCTTLQVMKTMAPSYLQMTLFSWPAQKSMIMIFRGTANFENVKTDLDFLFGKCAMGNGNCGKIHAGFNKVYIKHNKQLVDVFRKAIYDTGYNKRLFITGHSMGCALAEYMAYEVAAAYSHHFEHLYSVGLGCPRCGDKGFKAAFEKTYKGYFMRYNANMDVKKRLAADLKKVAQKIKTAVKKVATKIKTAVKHTATKIKEGIKGVANKVSAGLKKLFKRRRLLIEAATKGDDIITQIPPTFTGYHHIGPATRLDCTFGTHCTLNPLTWHSGVGYAKLLAKHYRLPARAPQCARYRMKVEEPMILRVGKMGDFIDTKPSKRL